MYSLYSYIKYMNAFFRMYKKYLVFNDFCLDSAAILPFFKQFPLLPLFPLLIEHIFLSVHTCGVNHVNEFQLNSPFSSQQHSFPKFKLQLSV